MSEPVTATPATAPSTDVLGTLSAGERSHWRLTGEFPAVSPADGPDAGRETPLSDDLADSSPAPPAEQVASTEASQSPASEPGPSKKRANAETRKAELAAQIQDLLKQRDALQTEIAARPTAPRDVIPAASSPAPQPVSLGSTIATPDLDAPILEEDAFFAAFPEAKVADYVRYVSRYEVLSAKRLVARESRETEARRHYASRLADVFAAQPDVRAALPPDLMGATPVSLMAADEVRGPWNYAAQEILDSAHTGAMFAHLATHPEIAAEIAAARTPLDTIRMIARIESRLDTSSMSPVTPVVKTTTSAPAPPQTLGTKPSAPANEIAAAVAAQDFARYASAMNAQERAR